MPRRQQGRRGDEKFASTATSSPRSGAPRLRASRATVGERSARGPYAAAPSASLSLRPSCPVAAARPPESGVAPPFGRAHYLCALRAPGCASDVTFALGDPIYLS